MHPSQASTFRKTIIALLSVAFAGTLLVFTAQANLDLLKTVYPNPQFYMFGLLALEGGVVYWTGYYLLQLSGAHRAIAAFTLAIDSLLSGVGFFYEMETITHSTGTIQLPPVIVVVAFAVVFNVAMSIISHLIPTHNRNDVPKLDSPSDYEYQATYIQPEQREHRQLAQTATQTGQGIGSIVGGALKGLLKRGEPQNHEVKRIARPVKRIPPRAHNRTAGFLPSTPGVAASTNPLPVQTTVAGLNQAIQQAPRKKRTVK